MSKRDFAMTGAPASGTRQSCSGLETMIDSSGRFFLSGELLCIGFLLKTHEALD